MMRVKLLFCSLAILAIFTTISQAQIFGIGYLGPDGLSTFYQINPQNG